MEYRVSSYGAMIADEIRNGAYLNALERTIRADSVVLDIGTGTGAFALLACRLGARRVFAVETDDVIAVAQEIAQVNGVSDRIEFIQARSSEIDLPEQADVIVSDLRGVLPLHHGHLPAIIDARRRHLAPGGALIPMRDTVWAALVEEPEAYRLRLDCWDEHARGFDLGSARQLVANSWWKQQVKEDQLLTEPLLVATLDYRTVEQADVQGAGSLSVSRSGTAHGVSVWYDSELLEGAGFSNAPGKPELIYGNAFFPLERPIEVASADTVDLRLGASLTGGNYVWRWNTRVARGGALRAEYRQSTALGFPLSRALLERSSERFVPSLDEGGDALRFVLASMSGELSVGEIATQTAERFPRLFPRDGDSLQYVVRLAQKHSR